MKTFAHKSACPWCGYHTEAASSDSKTARAPMPGDLMMCIQCGEWMVPDAQLNFRKPTDDEFVVIATDPDCRRYRAAWLAIQQAVQDVKGKPQ